MNEDEKRAPVGAASIVVVVVGAIIAVTLTVGLIGSVAAASQVISAQRLISAIPPVSVELTAAMKDPAVSGFLTDPVFTEVAWSALAENSFVPTPEADTLAAVDEHLDGVHPALMGDAGTKRDAYAAAILPSTVTANYRDLLDASSAVCATPDTTVERYVVDNLDAISLAGNTAAGEEQRAVKADALVAALTVGVGHLCPADVEVETDVAIDPAAQKSFPGMK